MASVASFAMSTSSVFASVRASFFAFRWASKRAASYSASLSSMRDLVDDFVEVLGVRFLGDPDIVLDASEL